MSDVDQAQRFIARKLPEPVLQFDWGLERYYEVQWEMWDTITQKRVGAVFNPLFADEKTCQGYANKWNYSAGPPVRCGSCGHVFAEGESRFGHEYYNLLCYGCSASNED